MSMLDDWYEDEYESYREDDAKSGPRVIVLAFISLIVFLLGMIFTLIFIH